MLEFPFYSRRSRIRNGTRTLKWGMGAIFEFQRITIRDGAARVINHCLIMNESSPWTIAQNPSYRNGD